MRPGAAPLGLPQKGGFDSGVQVRRYAHDWNLVEPSLKWLSAKFRAVLAGLTAAPESRSVPGLSSPNDGSHHWSQTPLSRRIVALGTWTAAVMRRFSPRDHRSERAKQCGRNIQKNGCRTTVLTRFGETPGKQPFTGDQVVCLGRDQAASKDGDAVDAGA
jgi:hypothetical protein